MGLNEGWMNLIDLGILNKHEGSNAGKTTNFEVKKVLSESNM